MKSIGLQKLPAPPLPQKYGRWAFSAGLTSRGSSREVLSDDHLGSEVVTMMFLAVDDMIDKV